MAAARVVLRSVALDACGRKTAVQSVDVIGRQVELGSCWLAREQEEVRIADLEDRDYAGLRCGLSKPERVAIEGGQAIDVPRTEPYMSYGDDVPSCGHAFSISS